MHRFLFAFSLLCLTACAVDGGAITNDDDAAGGGPVDLLLVVDNSGSMADEQGILRTTLPPALVDSGADLNVAVLTTDATGPGNGNGGNLRDTSPIGGTSCAAPAVLSPNDATFVSDLDTLLDVGTGGGGSESGLLAAALAICKAQPVSFWDGLGALAADDPVRAICEQVPSAERASAGAPPCNDGFFRPGATTVIAVVSDEGDALATSSSLPPGSALGTCLSTGLGECACRTQWFADFFLAGDPTVRVVAVTPSYQLLGTPADLCGSAASIPGPCNGFGSSTCSLDLYQQLSCETGGLYEPLESNVGGVTAANPPNCQLNASVIVDAITAGVAGL